MSCSLLPSLPGSSHVQHPQISPSFLLGPSSGHHTHGPLPRPLYPLHGPGQAGTLRPQGPGPAGGGHGDGQVAQVQCLLRTTSERSEYPTMEVGKTNLNTSSLNSRPPPAFCHLLSHMLLASFPGLHPAFVTYYQGNFTCCYFLLTPTGVSCPSRGVHGAVRGEGRALPAHGGGQGCQGVGLPDGTGPQLPGRRADKMAVFIHTQKTQSLRVRFEQYHGLAIAHLLVETILGLLVVRFAMNFLSIN